MGKSTLIDLTGQQFNRLKVIRRAPNRGKQTYWLCECQCENKTLKEVRGADLKNGTTKSCGCWKKEVDMQKIKEFNKSIGYEEHGMSDSRIYSIWLDMNRRCADENRERFKDYGGKGIEVCNSWKNSFKSFKDWALANGYSEELTIDRIDNNGDYEPDNCKWSTYKEQNNNRGYHRFVEINGVVKNVTQWCEELGMDKHLVRSRIHKGWSEEEALLIPIGVRRSDYYKNLKQ